MPDYIMRWLASRFLDVDIQEELGILTPAVRARKAAQEAASSHVGDVADAGERQRPAATATARTATARRAGTTAQPADRSADRHTAGRPGRARTVSTSGRPASSAAA